MDSNHVDFITFCCKADGHRLHALGQLKKQVESNGYNFDHICVVHQLCHPADFENPYFADCPFEVTAWIIDDLDKILSYYRIDINKPQYVSNIDKVHTWKNHVVNHLAATMLSSADYIVFADADCWMIRQPLGESWVQRGLEILQSQPDVFIVSPNDGEPERKTQVISQQMFMTRIDDFRQADFNQPGWDGDVRKMSELPEYAAMLEGRMHFYCKAVGKCRYVLSSEYRYWHHNRLTQGGNFETDLSKY